MLLLVGLSAQGIACCSQTEELRAFAKQKEKKLGLGSDMLSFLCMV